ncbi:hypothetical protein AB4Z48_16210 [Cupriavidus sp. 2TAF22]|uniref:hypothetical protein n=1 Tax=unclassified Cupriavidus TaxID=2640874 RepID=UPI003F8FC06E
MNDDQSLSRQQAETREPVLDVVDRVSEMCFGLFMALTFVGAVSTTTAGQDAGQTMLRTALGCNLAWGLVDAVMFLVRTLVNRGRRLGLVLAVRHAPDPVQGVQVIRNTLPKLMKTLVADAELEAIRSRLVASATVPNRPALDAQDLLGAVRIFCIVVLSTFPVALPFVLLDDVAQALILSRLLTLVMLFGGGAALGHYARFGALRTGLGMMALGVALTMAIIALGG